MVLPWGDSRQEGWPREWPELVNFSVLSLSLCLLLTWPLRNLSSLHKLFSSVWYRLQSREFCHCSTSSTLLPLAYPPSRTLHRPLSLPGTHTLSLLCLANLTASSKIPQVSSPPESLTGQCLLCLVLTGVGKPLYILPLALFDSLTHSTQHTALVPWPNSLNRLNMS